MPSTTIKYFCVDPGLVNLCGVLIEISGKGEEFAVEIKEICTRNIGLRKGKSVHLSQNLCSTAISDFLSIAKKADVALCEEQRFSVKTDLSYIQGAIEQSLMSHGLNVQTVKPKLAKMFYGIASGNYYKNKKLAIEKATEIIKERVVSDHIADCIIMALFHWQKIQHKLTKPSNIA